MEWKLFLTVFSTVFLAELGDKTQVATFLYAADAQNPRVLVFSASALALLVIYLLSLPVLLSFALNGALVGWTLPHMASTFLAFISLLQILVVAALGLLLVGMTALIARVCAPTRLGA